MKIVVFIKSVSRRSGGMSSAWDFAEALYKLGHDVSVLVNWKRLEFFKKQPDVTSIPFSKIYVIPDLLSDNKSRKESGSGIVYNLVKRLSRNDLNAKNALMNADLVLDASSLSQGAIQKVREINKGIKIVRNHAGSPVKFKDYWLQADKSLVEKDPWKRYLEYVSRYDGLLFQSSQQAKEFREVPGNGLNLKVGIVRPSCQETKILQSANSIGTLFDEEFFNVVIVGSIQKVKGIDLAVETLALLKEKGYRIKFHCVGPIHNENPEVVKYYKGILDRIKMLKLESLIEFYGHKSNYLEYMQNADLILQPSREEGVSRILREAMYMRKSVMAFRISGTEELFQDHYSADLIEPYDIQALAERIEKFINSDLGARQEKVNKAFETYLKSNSISVYYSTIQTLIPSFVS